jgi:hypothetical protein
MKQNEEIANVLRTNIQKLTSLYLFEKEKNSKLVEEINQLKITLDQNINKTKELEDKYSTLKMARAVESGNTDNTEAKQKINRLVREIDKCIALLNK